MAIRTKAPVLGDMSGKVGTVVLSSWNGLKIVKSTPKKRGNKKVSEELAQQNDLFKVVVKFFKINGKKIFKRGYQLRSKEHMTPFNLATSYHMKNAVMGTYPKYNIDLAKLKFSRPLNTTEEGWNAKFTGEEGGDLKVTWELNPYPKKTTQRDDEAIVVFYNATLGCFKVCEGVQRSSLECTFPIKRKPETVGQEIYSWLFFISADGKLVSETTYLGMLKMV